MSGTKRMQERTQNRMPKRIQKRTRKRTQKRPGGGRFPVLAVILIAAGVILMAVSVPLGDVRALFNKATHICLECIGIG